MSGNPEELSTHRCRKRYLLVSAEMGYGHHRAIYPLRTLSSTGNIININRAPGSSFREKLAWTLLLKAYEFLSRASFAPVIGKIMSGLLNCLLFIPVTGSDKDLSKPTIQARFLKYLIKKGICSGFTKLVSSSDLPVITSFYAPAIATEMMTSADVFCIICDVDINRVWVTENPNSSAIVYFSPENQASAKLRAYGINEKNIVQTGFPLPLELLGDRSLNVLMANFERRIRRLDGNGSFRRENKDIIESILPGYSVSLNQPEVLTLTYVVGGAGAQMNTGRQILKNLEEDIATGKIRLNLVAGTRKSAARHFSRLLKRYSHCCPNVRIISSDSLEGYFDRFNECLLTTDILWTKPSELSFYCGLGIPIILSPAIGPQELCNRQWLLRIGAGIEQPDPKNTRLWLNDLLLNGGFAKAAWNGFLNAEKSGTFKIMDFLERLDMTSRKS